MKHMVPLGLLALAVALVAAGGLLSALPLAASQPPGLGGADLLTSLSGSGTWTDVSVDLYGADIRDADIAELSTDGVMLFCTTQDGGHYYSSNDGLSWHPMNTDPPVQLLGSTLAVSPEYETDQTLYFGGQGCKAYRSTDGGANWTQAATGITDNSIWSSAISPAFGTDRTLWAASNNQVFRTTDAGDNWTSASGGALPGYIYDMAVAPDYDTSGTLFCVGAGGVFKTTNGGDTWAASSTGITETVVMAVAVSPDYGVDQTAFVGTMGGGVYVSTNGGASWVQQGPDGALVNALACSPNFGSDRMVVGGTTYGGVLLTANAGEFWTYANDGMDDSGPDVRAIAFHPDFATNRTLYVGLENWGMYKSTTGGTSWTRCSSGLTNVCVYAVSASPDEFINPTLLAGVDGMGVFQSTDGGASWDRSATGLPIDCDVRGLAFSPAFTSDNTAFAAAFMNGIYRSTDGGASWTSASTGLSPGRSYCVAASPDFATDRTLLMGGHNGYVGRSTDGGDTWTASHTGLPTDKEVLALAFSPRHGSDRVALAAVRSNGVYRSTDGGVTWSAYNTGISNPNLDDVAIALDPSGKVVAYAACMNGGVYRTADVAAAASWVQVDDEISYPGASALAISPDYYADGRVYAGLTHVNGSSDWGDTWSQTGAPPWGRYIGGMVAPPGGDGKLLVGVTAQGVWQFVPAAPGSPTPTSTERPDVTGSPTATGSAPTSTPTVTRQPESATPSPTCTSTAATATPSTTPTAGPSPTNPPPIGPICENMVIDGDFEHPEWGAWGLHPPAGYGWGHEESTGLHLGGETDTVAEAWQVVAPPPLPDGGFDLALDVVWENDAEEVGDVLELVVLANDDVELAHLEWQAVDPRGVWVHVERWVAVPPETETIEFYFACHNDGHVPSLFVVDNVSAVACRPPEGVWLPVVLR